MGYVTRVALTSYINSLINNILFLISLYSGQIRFHCRGTIEMTQANVSGWGRFMKSLALNHGRAENITAEG